MFGARGEDITQNWYKCTYYVYSIYSKKKAEHWEMQPGPSLGAFLALSSWDEFRGHDTASGSILGAPNREDFFIFSASEFDGINVEFGGFGGILHAELCRIPVDWGYDGGL